MAGLYPNDENIECFGETIKFPGLDPDGKFTNGDFSNPSVPPSRLDAGTINLLIDNLNSLITKLGGTPNNSGLEQLAALFTSAAEANRGIMRDASGRAQVAAPSAAEDVARKAEIDAEATARDEVQTNLNNHAKATNVHSATSVPTASRLMMRDSSGRAQVAAPSAAADIARKAEIDAEATARDEVQTNLNNHTGNQSNPHKVTAAQVGLGNCNNTADSNKSVNYANSAGSAGDADKVDGYHAGASAGCLIPITAFSFGSSSGYVKWANGLIIQRGYYAAAVADDGRVNITFPLAFTKGVSISVTAYDTDNDGTKSYFVIGESASPDGATINAKSGFRFCNTSNSVQGFYWLAIGY